MNVIYGRNVHDILPKALKLLFDEGVRRESRNGPVLQYPGPVTTVYDRPNERVVFWPERDANPFFHLYESLWMLAGRNDVAGPSRYVENMKKFSDDGVTYHGAYGHRWRKHFHTSLSRSEDQLAFIAKALKADPTDRRCVLQMWDTYADLGREGKDFPCNTIATFQISSRGDLDLTVFCRSNDIVWGAYGANAVHFSFLLEYMAWWIGVPVGKMYQVSVNWHGYLTTLEKVRPLAEGPNMHDYGPYATQGVSTLPFALDTRTIAEVDDSIQAILAAADNNFTKAVRYRFFPGIFPTICRILESHSIYKSFGSEPAILYLDSVREERYVDWVVAARQWLQRRIKP